MVISSETVEVSMGSLGFGVETSQEGSAQENERSEFSLISCSCSCS